MKQGPILNAFHCLFYGHVDIKPLTAICDVQKGTTRLFRNAEMKGTQKKQQQQQHSLRLIPKRGVEEVDGLK